jgi:hypothetical protein
MERQRPVQLVILDLIFKKVIERNAGLYNKTLGG